MANADTAVTPHVKEVSDLVNTTQVNEEEDVCHEFTYVTEKNQHIATHLIRISESVWLIWVGCVSSGSSQSGRRGGLSSVALRNLALSMPKRYKDNTVGQTCLMGRDLMFAGRSLAVRIDEIIQRPFYFAYDVPEDAYYGDEMHLWFRKLLNFVSTHISSTSKR